MPEQVGEWVVLQVAAAPAQDVGQGVARLGFDAMAQLDVEAFDIIEVRGKRSTGLIALPPYQEDAGLNIVRLDGLERHNAGIGVRDSVRVRKVDAVPARRVVFAPAQPNVRLTGSGDGLRRTLSRRCVVEGSVISTSVQRRNDSKDRSKSPSTVLQAFRQQHAFGLQEIRLVVVSTVPAGIVQIQEDSEISVLPEHVEPDEQAVVDVTYDDVGGIRDTVEQVREMIELPLEHPELFHRLGIDPPKGVLLHGPPGTGKTLLARAVASETDARFLLINGPEVVGRHYGESEGRLREIFQQAERNAPSIVFIDEIDSIAPKRSAAHGEGERRLVAQLLTLMDGLKPRQNVVVIGATNRPGALDEALRRPGRFDRELVIGVPDRAGRRDVLQIHTRGMPLTEEVDLDALARVTFGFVGADLSALCREAALEALRRMLPSIDLQEKQIPSHALEELYVSHRDFDAALKRVQPTALREIMIETPRVAWSDIGGLEETKRALREGIELPLKRPEAFQRMGIRPAKGFLLYGPPGTGKTLLAKAVAREAEANFIFARSSDLLSKWYGESEQQIARLFHRARQVAPTVIFLDEIESLAPRRGGATGESTVTERVVNTVLAEMDGLEELRGVVVMAATNQPNLVDAALLRPGRFDELIYVPVPQPDGREHILRIHTQNMPLADDVDLGALAQRAEGYTGADLEDLVRRAGLLALREDLDASNVSMATFEQAFQETHASVTAEMENDFRKIAETLQHEYPRTGKRIGF